MPTYGYQCTACENAFEVVQKITDDALTDCLECGGSLRKKIFPVGIQFKGSGFYVNDYAKGGNGEPSATAEALTKESKPQDKADAAVGAGPATPEAAAPAAPPAATPAAPAATPAAKT